ncbi:hypothetical protein AB6N01_00660 [Alcaligenes nematophilus]|uniref:hypothetical protein n=1 Tax=Alcaligenes nematophilus TaxID=2994643 RepID=UPI0034E08CA8
MFLLCLGLTLTPPDQQQRQSGKVQAPQQAQQHLAALALQALVGVGLADARTLNDARPGIGEAFSGSGVACSTFCGRKKRASKPQTSMTTRSTELFAQ